MSVAKCCTNILSLGCVYDCAKTFTTAINATSTGTYEFHFYIGATKIIKEREQVDTTPIVIPFPFEKQDTYVLKIYDELGVEFVTTVDTVDYDCYQLEAKGKSKKITSETYEEYVQRFKATASQQTFELDFFVEPSNALTLVYLDGALLYSDQYTVVDRTLDTLAPQSLDTEITIRYYGR